MKRTILHLYSLFSISYSALVVAVVAAGCEGEREQALRSEAGRLLRSIDLLHRAPNDGKAPHLAALKDFRCDSPDICELKRVCQVAYERHLQGVTGTRAVRAALAQDASSADDAHAAELLERSRHELEAARSSMRHCLELQGTARRHYRL
jgi:hypothetical protein